MSALFSCLLLVTDLLFLRVGTMARMEILCLFFALTSLFCIARTALDEISKPVGTIESLFSGIFLGLSFYLIHLALCLEFRPCIFFGEGNHYPLFYFGSEE
ncbi:hypothetical protein LEP1GSC170_4955 [Leptospira interrogans serovar Bataviae str. HAI135]|nr:hypothetical protein LEP1GSC170_4955 [Leptospira interrogans serovar Bataviae str. HAI135]